MRDPAARLILQPERVVRELRDPLSPQHFLNSELAREWRARGDLVDFEIQDERTVSSRRIPFVSLPAEWCDLQLHQAAELTLRLQSEAVAHGFDLKDASAWNVIFDGARPVFCDLLSFDLLTSKRWWAAGQFARHFILPLLLSRRCGLPAHKSFQAWRDGVPHEVARRMLGPTRFLTRYWPLMAEGGLGADANALPAPAQKDAIQSFRLGLNQSLDWMLRGVDPRRAPARASTWQNYVGERSHYSNSDLEFKRGQVKHWLSALAPGRVLDLGCNSGEFSRMAAAAGATVVAIDADHGAIERGAAEPVDRISLLVAPLDDLRGGYGWAGTEHAGLPARLHQHVDMTLMLALIHHLTLGASIPLEAVARFAADCTRRWLVIELISPRDVQIGVMQAQRNRKDGFLDMDAQLAVLAAAGFVPRERCELPSGTRVLMLMERERPA